MQPQGWRNCGRWILFPELDIQQIGQRLWDKDDAWWLETWDHNIFTEECWGVCKLPSKAKGLWQVHSNNERHCFKWHNGFPEEPQLHRWHSWCIDTNLCQLHETEYKCIAEEYKDQKKG